MPQHPHHNYCKHGSVLPPQHRHSVFQPLNVLLPVSSNSMTSMPGSMVSARKMGDLSGNTSPPLPSPSRQVVKIAKRTFPVGSRVPVGSRNSSFIQCLWCAVGRKMLVYVVPAAAEPRQRNVGYEPHLNYLRYPSASSPTFPDSSLFSEREPENILFGFHTRFNGISKGNGRSRRKYLSSTSIASSPGCKNRRTYFSCRQQIFCRQQNLPYRAMLLPFPLASTLSPSFAFMLILLCCRSSSSD